MSESIQLSSNTVRFELSPHSARAYSKLVIKNLENKLKAFQIKTSRRGRYIVNPASCILEPHQTLEIEFVINSPPSERNIKDICSDQFYVKLADLADRSVTKDKVAEYLSREGVEAKKIYITTSATEVEDGEKRQVIPEKKETDPSKASFLSDKDSFSRGEYRENPTISAPSKTPPIGSVIESTNPPKLSNFGQKQYQNAENDIDSNEEVQRLRSKNASLEQTLKQLSV